MALLFIGAVNVGNIPTGGEEYKNRLLIDCLNGHKTVKTIDTYLWAQRPKIIVKLFKSLFFEKHDQIVISASSVSVYKLVYFLQFFPTLARKCTYFVIGGFLPSAIQSGRFKIEPYNVLYSIVVEGKRMRETLIDLGCSIPIYQIPNFKKFPLEFNLQTQVYDKFRFVFISRICHEKGVRDIFVAARILRRLIGLKFTISFYGPISDEFSDEFESELNEYIFYEGILDLLEKPDSSYCVLAEYDTMLFPTKWYGEGFPGVLIDAFVVGLPVIATDWNMNAELIVHEENGLLIPASNPKLLAKAMLRLMTDDSLKIKMSANSRSLVRKYHVDYVCPEIISVLKQ